METDYVEIPFFKIPRYIKNFKFHIDEIAIRPEQCNAKYVYFINREEQIIIVGWTFQGSQFIEIRSVFIYKNSKAFIAFLDVIETRKKNHKIITHTCMLKIANKMVCSYEAQDILPKFYLTSKYNNELSHLYTWNYMDRVKTIG